MTLERWTEIDRDIADLLHLEPAPDDGLSPHEVTPPQGKLLQLLARMCGARSMLEIGTLGGYSTIWLARALPADGRLVTLEIDPDRARVAVENLARANIAAEVQIRIGDARETLREVEGPFDLIFIDADKRSNPDYLRRSLELSRPGTVIVADNVIREGDDEHARGAQRFLEMLGEDPRIEATVIQTVGAKGHDGFALAVVSDR